MKRTEQELRNQPQKATIHRQEADRQETDRQEEVRRRAYQLYEERGMQDGFEVEDWLRAESEILDNPRMQKAA